MLTKRLRDLREDHDLKEWQVGEIISCSQRTYSNYECGDVVIPLDRAIRLADYYGVSLDYLTGRTDKKEINK